MNTGKDRPRKERVNISITKDSLSMLDGIAKHWDVDRSGMITRMIREKAQAEGFLPPPAQQAQLIASLPDAQKNGTEHH